MKTYIARNTRNGKFYIGSTTDFEHRKWQHHKHASELPFHRALRKNPDDFEWEVFEDESEGREWEQALLDLFFGTEMCYNLNPNADSVNWSPAGRFWICREGEEKWCEEGEEIPEGWKRGRSWQPSEEARESWRQRATGWRHPNQLSNTGRRWVRNPEKTEEKFLQVGEETPAGWQPGRIPQTQSQIAKDKVSQAMGGRKWWHNDEGKTCFSHECPQGWRPGRKPH